MFYLDIPIDQWLIKYPALQDEEPLCDCKEPDIIPFRTRKSVGLVCKDCNSGTWIRAKVEDNFKLLNLFYSAL